MGLHIVSFEPTPNPNALKLLVEPDAGDRPRSYFSPAEAAGDPLYGAAVLGALAAVLALTLALMLVAGEVQRLLGRTGVHVVARVFGVILAALAVQFMLDGVTHSGLLGVRPGASL